MVTQCSYAVRLSAALTSHEQVSNIATHFAVRYILRQQDTGLALKNTARELRVAYVLVRAVFSRLKIPFQETDAGFFIFAKLCRDLDPEHERHFIHLLKEHQIALASRTIYHFNDTGWFQMCYAVPKAILLEGLERIQACIRQLLHKTI